MVQELENATKIVKGMKIDEGKVQARTLNSARGVKWT